MDVGAKAEVHALIEALAADGVAVLLVSSDLPELLALSHRILVLREGRVAGELPRAEASEEAVAASDGRGAAVRGRVTSARIFRNARRSAGFHPLFT